MRTRDQRILFCLLAAVVAIGAAPAGAVSITDGDILNAHLNNGMRATIYTAEYLETLLEPRGTSGTIYLEDFYLNVITDIDHPAIANKGDGRFFSFELEQVLAILNEINYPGRRLDLEIFILPYPRENILVSSASGSRIYLSPQVHEISRTTAAYVIAHEVGHVYQYRYLPHSAQGLWDDYRRIRNIENRDVYHNGAVHQNRPEEIFAEDFRVFFGGPSAYFAGYIENPHLESPERVVGLEMFFAKLGAISMAGESIVGLANYPNPFNPTTEIRVQVAGDMLVSADRVRIRVYDVRGALVRDLYTGRATGPDIRVTWDGRDNAGNVVASSTYFGVVEAGAETQTVKMLMIK
jgi:hypothetical protein